MKKHLIFLFTGLALSAAAMGFIRKPTYQKVEAASDKLEYDEDDKITLGSFPMVYDANRSDEMSQKNNSSEYIQNIVDSFGENGMLIVQYQGVKYGYLDGCYADTDEGRVSSSSIILSDGKSTAEAASYRQIIFDYTDLKWVKYAEEDDCVDFISEYTIFRNIYNNNPSSNIDYSASSLYDRLNDDFFNIAFSIDDLKYLDKKDIDGNNAYIDIPEIDKVTGSKEPKCEGPSDLAILSEISSHEGIKNSPYWTKTKAGSDRMTVKWTNKSSTECLCSDNKIGVRPIIRIKADMLKAYSGGGSSKKSSTPTSNANPAIALGIVFGVLGAGSLVTFFILWNKKLKEDPTYKSPGWYYAIIFVASAFCCVSIISFSTQSISGEGGGGIGGTKLKYGYYLQSSAPKSSGGISQVGLNCWLIKEDGTVNYCAYVEASDASDFVADNGHGTWTQSGSKLNITYTSPFGTSNYSFTVSGEKLLKNGTEVFHWVRGE